MTDDHDPLDLDFLLREDISDADSQIPAASIVDWRTLKGLDARVAWDALRDWVQWFTVRYNISESTVPVCWYRHGRLVDELSALRDAHIVAFAPSDRGFGPIGWHELLEDARPRLRDAYFGQCSREGHRDSYKPRSWTNAVDAQEWDALINQAPSGGS